jgi:elongation factor P
MKQAQELRSGNVIMVGKDPMVILKAEYSKGGRSSAVVKMKLKNLLSVPAWKRFTRPTTSLSC